MCLDGGGWEAVASSQSAEAAGKMWGNREAFFSVHCRCSFASVWRIPGIADPVSTQLRVFSRLSLFLFL